MTTPHTPPTQAELDAWKKLYLIEPETVAHARILRLIAEVERLRTPKYSPSSETIDATILELARLTKEVEELRKDKERLRWILQKAYTVHEDEFWMIPSIVIHYGGSGNIDADLDAAMQQKGEE